MEIEIELLEYIRKLEKENEELKDKIDRVSAELAYIAIAPFSAAGINFDKKRKDE